MKKALLLLFLFLSFSISAQINQAVTPYQLCSIPNINGFAYFDLTTKIPEILQGQNPTENYVTFYQTSTDSQTGSSPIANPTNYISPANPFTIYVRVVNIQSGDILGLTMFQCEALPPPTANPANLDFCDMMELAIYNLNDADNQITGSSPNSIVSYHETLVDAQTGASAIPPGGYVPLVNPGTQTLYARVVNAATGCFNTTTLTLHTHNCGPCQTPTAVVNASVTFNSALIGWTESGTATTWEIVTVPAGSPSPALSGETGLVTPSNPYIIAGLIPNTSYDVYVRSICYNGLSDWSQPTTVTTITAPPVCGGNFVDQGGTTNNYSNNSNQTTTICPTTPGEGVTVTFTSFNTEVLYDAMYVYNGNTVTTSALIPSAFPVGNVPGGVAGGYWGNLTGVNLPGPFTSSSLDGCLTFVFRSDANNTLEGWVANVTCAPVVCETPTGLIAANITGTSVVLNWNNPSGSTAWEVIVLPQGSPLPTASSSGTYVQTPLPYIVTGLSPDGCYTAYVRSWCSSPSEWSSPVNFCMFNCENNAECAESLVLTAFLDSNNNGVKDTGEPNFNQGSFVYQVNDSGNNLYGNSNNSSYYIFDSNPANSYDINFVINSELNAYYTSSVSYTNVTLPDGSGANYLYFPIVNILPHVDAQVYLSPYGQPRPGFTYINAIYYQNNGLQTIANGTLIFTHAPNVSISSVSQPGVTTTSTGFTYDFTNLAPNEGRYINVTLLVPTIPTVNLGDLVTNTVTIQIAGDINLSNNSSSITQTIVGSYDPNDKMESHGGKIVHANFTSNDYLYYTIQFENTGTANAEFIRVEDALDSHLDESTFEMISASHNVNTKRFGNQLTWHFYNINLPPTSANPSGSHGYVSFRIKPKAGYAIGDIIPNTASIHFDYNPAITTNTFNTEFVQALANTTFSAGTISLYPNPTSNRITISNNGTERISKLAIYDVTGKRIYNIDDNSLDAITIDVSHYEKGIYLVELTSDTNSKITKKLILK